MLIKEPNKRIKLTAKRRLDDGEDPVEAIKTPNTIIETRPKKKKKRRSKRKKKEKKISSQIQQKTPVRKSQINLAIYLSSLLF
jgi:hypothetical protein